MIKYNKGSTNKLVGMLSRIPTSKIKSLENLMHMDPFTNDAYKEAYSEYEDFKELYQQLQSQIHVHEGDNTIQYHP